MLFKALLICSCLCAVFAYPMEDLSAIEEYTPYEEPQFIELEPLRVKRQFNMQGGGSPGRGYDVSANARFPIWQSHNQRSSVHGIASYAQHLGGPYGNSKPAMGGGVQYTYKF